MKTNIEKLSELQARKQFLEGMKEYIIQKETPTFTNDPPEKRRKYAEVFANHEFVAAGFDVELKQLGMQIEYLEHLESVVNTKPAEI